MDSNAEGITKDKDMESRYGSKTIIDDQRIKQEPAEGLQVITDGPVSPPCKDPDKAKWDKFQSEVMEMIKPPSSTQGTVATTAPSVVSNLTDDNKPSTIEVGTSTGAEESTDGTVLVVSPKASRSAQNLTETSTRTAVLNKEATREASLQIWLQSQPQKPIRMLLQRRRTTRRTQQNLD